MCTPSGLGARSTWRACSGRAKTGLTGHSDGDVAAHAACDALLSAAGLGDLGANFGTAEAQWAGAPGTALLQATAALVARAGYAIGNVAIQVIGKRPRLSPRRQEAEKVLSEALGGDTRQPVRDHHGRAGPDRPAGRYRGHRHGPGGRAALARRKTQRAEDLLAK